MAILRGLRVFLVKMLSVQTRDLTTLLGTCCPSVHIIMIILCEFRSYLKVSHDGGVVADETMLYNLCFVLETAVDRWSELMPNGRPTLVYIPVDRSPKIDK